METSQTTPRLGRSIPESVRAGARELRELDRESQYDLLTAAILGVAVGAAATLLISAGARPRPKPRRLAQVRGLGEVIVRGGRRKGKLPKTLSPDVLRHQVSDLMESAREAVTDTVEAELKDLRKSIRRQRRRLGI